jgi:hypothetical protein
MKKIRIPKDQLKKCSRFRVENPHQKPITTPATIDSCSSAIRDPLLEGGAISEMYKGDSMLVNDNEGYKLQMVIYSKKHR